MNFILESLSQGKVISYDEIPGGKNGRRVAVRRAIYNGFVEWATTTDGKLFLVLKD